MALDGTVIVFMKIIWIPAVVSMKQFMMLD